MTTATSAKELALVRWKLMRELREYQLFKHVEIFDPIAASGPSARASLARSCKERCIAIAAAYNDHVQRWSARGPASAWDTYSSEALIMIDRIDDHLANEDREVQALLIGIDRTRQAF